MTERIGSPSIRSIFTTSAPQSRERRRGRRHEAVLGEVDDLDAGERKRHGKAPVRKG